MEVGFVGAVTEELPTLVSPAGIADIEVDRHRRLGQRRGDRPRRRGRRPGGDAGARGCTVTDCATMDDSGNVGGHRLRRLPRGRRDRLGSHPPGLQLHVPRRAVGAEGRAVTERPVVSAGQYGTNLNQLLFTVTARRAWSRPTRRIFPRKPVGRLPAYPADPAVTQIVDGAEDGGRSPRRHRAGHRSRRVQPGAGSTATGTDNRGGESTLGNMVAEVQQWATEAPRIGGAEIAFMNPAACAPT